MVTETIRKSFAFLFDKYHFKIASETYFDSFGNWIVVLASDDYCVRLSQDRGYIDVAIGPLCQQSSWETGPWFNLDMVLLFVSEGKDSLDGIKVEFGNLSQQLKELAKAYQPYSQSICETFRAGAFQSNQEKLRLFEKHWTERLWEKLKTSKQNA